MSIRTKLIFTFVAVSLLPMIAMLYLLSLRLTDSFEKMSQPRIRSALNGISSEIHRKTRATRDRVEDVAENQMLIERTFLYSYSPRSLIDEVVRIREAAGLDVLKVIDPEGRLLASGADRARFGVTVKNIAAVHRAMRQAPVTMIERERIADEEYVSLNVYQPIYYNGTVLAVLAGGSFIDVEYVKMLEDLSTANVILYIGTEPIVGTWNKDLETTIGKSDFLKNLRAKGLTSIPLMLGERKHIVGGVPVHVEGEDEPLGYFVMALSLKQEEEIVEEVKIYILLLAIGVVLVSVLAGSLLSLSLTRPVTRLVGAARRIGHGELDGVEVDVKSRDEIGLLGRTFNNMMRDLKEYRERLVMTERTAAWRDIARSIAHEIKNPLSPIQLSVENLKKSFSTNRRRFDHIFPECTDTILEEVERLRKMATEFSDFARMPLPVFEEADLHEAIESAAQLFRETADSRKVDILIGKTKSLKVQADRSQLLQVFENILKNSIEAMAGGGEVKITEKEIEGKAVVVVEDNGPGIPKENLQKIFSPYFTTKSVGSGLGLSIVQRILNDHGASIEIHSDEGVGTWLIITFPEPGTALERREETPSP